MTLSGSHGGVLSATEYVYRHLKEGTSKGLYPPGSRIKVDKIAQDLSVSRTPVREAILRLSSEGLVDVHPRKHTIVTKMSAKDLLDLYTVRLQLELMACPLIVANISDDDIRILEELLDAAQEKDESDLEGIRANSHEFHGVLWNSTENKYLSRVLSELFDMSWRYIRPSIEIKKSMSRTLLGHRRIVEALRGRSTEALSVALEFDLGETRKAIEDLLAEGNDSE